MHKVFISYHHKNDQYYKDKLSEINKLFPMFIDQSVDTGDISDELSDESIREIIRDEYLRDSAVTIVLVGTETKKRKHVDWEIYSSMYDGKINKKSGIIIINLPSINCSYYTVAHEGEKEKIHPEITSWISIENRSEYERRYPYMPDRIIDNLLEKEAKISVVGWDKIENDFGILEFLIDVAFNDKKNCIYNLSRPMKRDNS